MPHPRIGHPGLNPPQEGHPGLWLDKYIDALDNKAETLVKLVREVVGIQESPLYRDFFAAWRKTLKDLGAQFADATCSQEVRFIVGMGMAAVLENSLSLHRTYGVPYLPGSALKGVASNHAAQREGNWTRGKNFHQELFGDTSLQGVVHFFDALPLPGKWTLWADGMTPHHDYGDRDKAPADWDSPNPIRFLSASGTFLVALAGDGLWVKVAHDILKDALAKEGIGAKTSSGFGAVSLGDLRPEPQQQ